MKFFHDYEEEIKSLVIDDIFVYIDRRNTIFNFIHHMNTVYRVESYTNPVGSKTITI